MKNPFIQLKEKLPKPLRNKYALTLTIFFIWMIFFDKNSMINQFKKVNAYYKLKGEVESLKSGAAENQDKVKAFLENKKVLEKLARERYLMKRKNEDVYILTEE